MKINDIIEKFGRKRLTIIASVVLALIILIAIILVLNTNKKSVNTSNNSADNTHLSDFLMNDEIPSTKDNSSSEGSKVDSKTDSSIIDNLSSLNSKQEGSSISDSKTSSGNSSSSTSNQGGTSVISNSKASDGSSSSTSDKKVGSSTPGGTSQPPTTPTSMTFTISSFTPYAEKNLNTGLGKPVFEYIFGVQSTENGIPTKYIQQRDTVVLQTNIPVTSVDAIGFITATYSGNTITIKAKVDTNVVDVQDSSITVNGKYKYNFHVYRVANYSDEMSIHYATYVYFTSKGMKEINYDFNMKGYTGGSGDASKSITHIPFLRDGEVWYDDSIAWNGPATIAPCFNLIDKYHARGFKNVRSDSPPAVSDHTMLFIAY